MIFLVPLGPGTLSSFARYAISGIPELRASQGVYVQINTRNDAFYYLVYSVSYNPSYLRQAIDPNSCVRMR